MHIIRMIEEVKFCIVHMYMCIILYVVMYTIAICTDSLKIQGTCAHCTVIIVSLGLSVSILA